MEVPRPGIDAEPQLQPTPQLSNTRSSNPLHWAGNGTLGSTATQAAAIEFCATDPQQELFFSFFLFRVTPEAYGVSQDSNRIEL